MILSHSCKLIIWIYKSLFSGYFAATVAVCAGITAGAQISKNIAILLEENELFVPSDDDDDD